MTETALSPLLLKLKAWAENNPALILGLLRNIKPILKVKNFVLVTRYDDVQEVLARDDVFQVTYKDKMEKVTSGKNFFLGMQNSPDYERDVSVMRLAIRREDVAGRVAGFVAQTAERIMAAAPGRIDLVPELSKLVPTMWVGDYFGTPGWQREEFAEAASLMFAYLFFPSTPESEKIALAAAATTCAYLDQVIAQQKALRKSGADVNTSSNTSSNTSANTSAPPLDDVVNRCLNLQEKQVPGTDDLSIRNNLIGMIIGAIPTTSKCVVLCIDYLLSHPELLAGAQTAALTDDDALVNQYVLESLRLNPFGPGLLRHCAQDYVLGAGAWRSTKIAAGSTVFVTLQSAMWDGRKIPSPSEFRVNRPAYSYMHFGYGLHTCSGQYINAVQIAGIVKVLLKRKNLRRASGAAGQVQMAGAFPGHLVLEFDR